MRLYSEPGIGTTVKVHLPVTSADDTRLGAIAEPPPRLEGNGETVLVVEDEDAVRQLSERILLRAGYRVLLAGRGDAALEICARDGEVIDLLLTDVVMPGMLGPELVARVSDIRPELPVLYMSGYIHQIAGELGTGGGGTPFIEKPFTADGLLAGVRDALEGADGG